MLHHFHWVFFSLQHLSHIFKIVEPWHSLKWDQNSHTIDYESFPYSMSVPLSLQLLKPWGFSTILFLIFFIIFGFHFIPCCIVDLSPLFAVFDTERKYLTYFIYFNFFTNSLIIFCAYRHHFLITINLWGFLAEISLLQHWNLWCSYTFYLSDINSEVFNGKLNLICSLQLCFSF